MAKEWKGSERGVVAGEEVRENWSKRVGKVGVCVGGAENLEELDLWGERIGTLQRMGS